MEIILGSQSKGRNQVLLNAGYKFLTIPADIDEKAIRSEDYKELPLLIARAKAEALISRIVGNFILITADQVVECNGSLREKPESHDEARESLRSYTDFPAQTNSAVVVTNLATRKQASDLDIARTYFKPIPETVIERLIEEGSILESAGSFIIENPLLSPYVDHIDGTPDSVQGLPLEMTIGLIDQVLQ